MVAQTRTKLRNPTGVRPGAATRLAVFGLGTTAVTAGAVGQIQFGDPFLYSPGGAVSGLVPADFDRDADTDLAVLTSPLIRIYFNDGSGSLAIETTIPLERTGSHLTAGRIDEDANTDLVWVEYRNDLSYSLTFWFNAGDGHTGDILQLPISSRPRVPIMLTDLEEDGRLDVVFSPDGVSLSAMQNRGNRTFELVELYTNHQSQYDLKALTAGDFDLDGDTDLVAMYQEVGYNRGGYEIKGTQLLLLVNDGVDQFRIADEHVLSRYTTDNMLAAAMAAGDLDGDGDLDVAVHASSFNENVSNSVLIVRNDEGESLHIAADYRGGFGEAGDIRATDLDTDGRLELVSATNGVRGVYVMRNEGEMQFTQLSPFYSRASDQQLSLGDLDGDGQSDLVRGGGSVFAVVSNETELDGPRLAHTRLVRGRMSTFAVRGAPAGEVVYFVHSLSGEGSTLGQRVLGGLVLDLLDPIVEFGSARANQDGEAMLRVTVPPDAPLGPVSVQAVVRRGRGGSGSVKTQFSTALIEE